MIDDLLSISLFLAAGMIIGAIAGRAIGRREVLRENRDYREAWERSQNRQDAVLDVEVIQ